MIVVKHNFYRITRTIIFQIFKNKECGLWLCGLFLLISYSTTGLCTPGKNSNTVLAEEVFKLPSDSEGKNKGCLRSESSQLHYEFLKLTKGRGQKKLVAIGFRGNQAYASTNSEFYCWPMVEINAQIMQACQLGKYYSFNEEEPSCFYYFKTNSNLEEEDLRVTSIRKKVALVLANEECELLEKNQLNLSFCYIRGRCKGYEGLSIKLDTTAVREYL